MLAALWPVPSLLPGLQGDQQTFTGPSPRCKERVDFSEMSQPLIFFFDSLIFFLSIADTAYYIVSGEQHSDSTVLNIMLGLSHVWLLPAVTQHYHSITDSIPCTFVPMTYSFHN